jgi:uncharacterized OB-fold protein
MEPNEKPRLVLTAWTKGEPLAYQCSRCGQAFIPPEDRDPKDAAKELQTAFQDHLREEHADEAKD